MYLLQNLALLLSFMMMTKGLAVDRISESDEKEKRDILPRSLSDDDSEFRMKVATFVNHLVEYFLEERAENAKKEMNLSRNKLESSENWSEADLSQYWSKILGTGNEIKTFNKKYTKKWPHCRNVGCKMGGTQWDFAADCSKNSECDGFSFTTDQPLRGSGCMKSCGNNESSEGYGSGTHDFWEKENEGTEVFAFDGDDLMATNWDDDISYWRGLANEVQDSRMFRNIKNTIKVYYIKTYAKTFGTKREDYGIVGLAQDNSKNRWVIFPGAQGIQLHYGTEGAYRKFAFATENQSNSNKVHRNYFNAFRATRFIMQEFLADAPNEVIFTGHSKGGLQATHAAYYMTTEKSDEFCLKNPSNKVSLYVFGAPNLGNENVSNKLSHHVKHFKEAIWYNVKRTMKCGLSGSTYRFYDFISYNRFKYHGNGGDQDWIKTKKEYFPRGISEEHDFYTPNLDNSEFEYKVKGGQTWGCEWNDWLYHKGLMSKKKEWDYEFYNRVKSHQLSYALSSQD